MDTYIQYTIPEIPILLTTVSLLYFINLANSGFNTIINAGLIGPLAIGIIYGPEVANILPSQLLEAFTVLGYIGLLLLVFEAGLDTNVNLLVKNIYLSTVVAFTGIGFPIAFSLLLLVPGYGYGVLPAFAAGAALCSTSLGTTLSLIRPEFKSTRTGTVLLSAALIDDIVGLVLAAIIPQLSPKDAGSQDPMAWSTIVRPIGVSLAFGLGTPILAYVLRRLLSAFPQKSHQLLQTGSAQVFIIMTTLSGFVSGSKYAGTSELFGAYLAGALLAYTCPSYSESSSPASEPPNTPKPQLFTPAEAFTAYFRPVFESILSPVFFASIGFSLPVRSLFLVNGSRRVIWRGIVYSGIMIVAKALTGVWILVWPHAEHGRNWFGRSMKNGKKVEAESGGASTGLSTRVEGELVDAEEGLATAELMLDAPEDKSIDNSSKRAAFFIGLAMVPRGEIALIVAQLARPLLDSSGADATAGSEPFAVVIWAILITTIGGALGVGVLLRRWDKRG